MRLVEKIPLPNELELELWNLSRAIAADTTKVEALIRIKMEIRPSYFDSTEPYETTRRVFGRETFFEYRLERTFVASADKDRVFQDLWETFKKDTLPYLSKPDFPRRFALAKYREILKNPYKYGEDGPDVAS
ncbi:MAG: hypothetical protein PHY31_06335 [Smithellaceae bacterium]|nr:hypothetical protein [Smithellaceae bacterium]